MSSESARARIWVVDDDHAVREAIGFMLDSHQIDYRLFDSAEAMLAALKPADRGCLLLDVKMPGMDGLALQTRLHEAGITMPVVFISGHGDIRTAVRAVQAGALDFLEKPFDAELLLEKLDNALEIDRAGQAELAALADVEQRLARLTPREREVMEGMLEGKLNKLIAADLDISVRTVEIHRANVLDKLEARNGSDLVRVVLSSQSYRDWLL
ncbi:response regulator transcription factor [Wenzhouxiangella limi]|uniref:Response regulator transcription factor n=1 Tax=Wenzhouxiangella limi TaxID=2707351 RepID=A0A845V169_9GAMM|nr:response regulator [Wenzhouxiangella limi]NDY96474.1 response regulator transcription factor [Wenzhouxiangella limi]